MGFFSDTPEENKNKQTAKFIKEKGGVVKAVNPKNYKLLELEQNDTIINLLGGILTGQGFAGAASAAVFMGIYNDKVKELIE